MASLPDETKQKMLTALEHLKMELKTLRTSRANPAMVDGVHVELYGSSMKIKELASISAPEARMLLISPFDPKNVGLISKAIEKANIGINPLIDGHVIRLKIPHMDENSRKEMVKISHKKKEEAKVTIRNIRRDMNDHARKMNKEGTLPEDQLKKLEKTIQEHTDKFCKEADDLALAKEKEIMTI